MLKSSSLVLRFLVVASSLACGSAAFAQASMYYSMGDGSIKVITPGVGIKYSDPPAGSRALVTTPSAAPSTVAGGRYGVTSSPSGWSVGAKATLPANGGPMVVDVSSRLVKPSLKAAAIGLLKTVGKLSPYVQAGVAIYDLLKDNGITPTVGADGDVSLVETTLGSGYEYSVIGFAQAWRGDPTTACCVHMGASCIVTGTTVPNTLACHDQYWRGGYGMYANPKDAASTRSVTPEEAMDKIFDSSTSNQSKVPQVINDALSSGESIETTSPTVTGPSSQVGPTTTTQNADGTTTTKTTNHSYTYNGNTISSTTVNQSTTVNNTTNQTTVTTETIESPKPEEGPSQCELNPKSNACREDEFDTPDGEIPKSTETITYEAEDLGFGGGTCPADVVLTFHGGQVVKAWDWAGSCSKIVTYAKPLILALATFAALMIIFAPGRES